MWSVIDRKSQSRRSVDGIRRVSDDKNDVMSAVHALCFDLCAKHSLCALNTKFIYVHTRDCIQTQMPAGTRTYTCKVICTHTHTHITHTRTSHTHTHIHTYTSEVSLTNTQYQPQNTDAYTNQPTRSPIHNQPHIYIHIHLQPHQPTTKHEIHMHNHEHISIMIKNHPHSHSNIHT